MMNGEQEFDELRRAHERLETQVETVLPTLATKAEMKQGFDRVDARFDKMEARFDKMEARLDKMEERFDRKFERLYYLLLAGLGAALIAAFSMINALSSRPAYVPSPPVAAASGPAPATSALNAWPPGTVLVLTVPATAQVASAPQP